jgi:hypothetical protein
MDMVLTPSQVVKIPTQLVQWYLLLKLVMGRCMIVGDLLFRHLFFCSGKRRSALPNRAIAGNLQNFCAFVCADDSIPMVLYSGVNGTQSYKLIRSFENLIYVLVLVKDPGVGTRI